MTSKPINGTTRTPNPTQAAASKAAAVKVARGKSSKADVARSDTMAERPLPQAPTPTRPALPIWPHGTEAIGGAAILTDPRLAMVARCTVAAKEVLGDACKSIKVYWPLGGSTAIAHVRLMPVCVFIAYTDGRILSGALHSNITDSFLEDGYEVQQAKSQAQCYREMTDHLMNEHTNAVKEAVERGVLRNLTPEGQKTMADKQKTQAEVPEAMMTFDAGYGDVFQVRDNAKAELYEVWQAVTEEVGQDTYRTTGWKRLGAKGEAMMSDALRLLASEMDRIDAEAKAAREKAEADAKAAATRKPAQAPRTVAGGKAPSAPAKAPSKAPTAKGGHVAPVLKTMLAKAPTSNRSQAAKSSAVVKGVVKAAKSPQVARIVAGKAKPSAKATKAVVARKVAPKAKPKAVGKRR